MPRYLYSFNDDPPPSTKFAVDLPDDATAFREAALAQEELCRNEPNRIVSINIWNEHGIRIGRVGSSVNAPAKVPRGPGNERLN
jgi:hypothetical protein